MEEVLDDTIESIQHDEHVNERYPKHRRNSERFSVNVNLNE